jgi:hypothetical protein
MKNTNKIYPKLYEHVVTYKTNDEGKLIKTLDLQKKIKGKKYTLKGTINGKRIKIKKTLKKVRFPKDLISPNKKPITSMKNSFVPRSILK